MSKLINSVNFPSPNPLRIPVLLVSFRLRQQNIFLDVASIAEVANQISDLSFHLSREEDG